MIQNVLNAMKKVAEEDGTITVDEQNLLDTMNDFMQRYETYLGKAEEDGIITEEEAEKLQSMRRDMLEGLWAEAAKDGKISDDETEIMKLLYKFLTETKFD